METFKFKSKKEGIAKLEELFLSEPSKIYNLYKKLDGSFILRNEAKSNG